MHKIIIILLLITVPAILAKKSDENSKPEWAKKDIRDFNDADMERLLEQWEEDDDPLEPDELPEHLRPQPKIDLSKLNTGNPEDVLKVSKKGRTLMTFVSVTGKPTRDEAETITKLWQTSLWNNHIQAERYMVDDDRAIFLFKDGAQAWEAKDFLVQQERCKGVTIENKEYPGEHKSAKTEL
ncbi:LDLR chaperone boca [Episyrphus balteatus]|uniref:LDLR chaperone boca n=1 Tax=Episyrphus balteatus TaxID=286459 RepID=UPI0024858DC9|nr:LDLR chaperone boca [Episyrphus balteatus]